MSTLNDKDKEVQKAHVDKAIAEDVAVGMAAKADYEEARADNLAVQNARQSARLSEVRSERDGAALSGAIAREDARGSSFAFWMLLGVVAVALTIGAFYFATRPEPTSTSVTINRQAPATAPTSNPSSSNLVQQPAAAPPAPVVVREPVAVPVPVERTPPPTSTTIVVQQPEGTEAAPSETPAAPSPEGTTVPPSEPAAPSTP